MLMSHSKHLGFLRATLSFVISDLFGASMIAVFRRNLLTLLTAGVVSLSIAANAQSGNATLQGTVTDSNGGAVPNAQIHITAQQTGVTRDVVTNSDGFYSAPNLSAASYKVTTSRRALGRIS